jgi:hypothetical protein
VMTTATVQRRWRLGRIRGGGFHEASIACRR